MRIHRCICYALCNIMVNEKIQDAYEHTQEHAQERCKNYNTTSVYSTNSTTCSHTISITTTNTSLFATMKNIKVINLMMKRIMTLILPI